MKIETPAGRYARASRSDGGRVSRFLSVREQTHLSTIQKGRLKNEPPQILDAQKTIQILCASQVLHQEEREMKGYETLSFTTTFLMTGNTIF